MASVPSSADEMSKRVSSPLKKRRSDRLPSGVAVDIADKVLTGLRAAAPSRMRPVEAAQQRWQATLVPAIR